ncbi:ribonuclease HII [Olegusella massiliensis]|uniref:ribonuclease HII n=1 Tax=Olegusella massiliensis TaxID=1776381 RepID=UPI000837EE3D|nr:ribonuclease HII [Olegusella massiliensis]MBS5865885.1 ribonuclease HII [Coriobacteriaceae bacterium]
MSVEHAATAREIAGLFKTASHDEIDNLISRYAEDPRAQVQQALKSARRRQEHFLRERSRVHGMYLLQKELGGSGITIGVDEVGRGAIAGPLTVAAVVLPDEPEILGVNDSKQLSPQQRSELALRIQTIAVSIGISHIPAELIDKQGMAASLRQAMSEAIVDTGVEPDSVLIDGNPVHAHPKERTIVKGDAKIAAIAAASIVAKVTRDQLMVEYDKSYPEYHFASCKGYGSAEHIAAIKQFGLTPLHRVSFCSNFVEMPSLF